MSNRTRTTILLTLIVVFILFGIFIFSFLRGDLPQNDSNKITIQGFIRSDGLQTNERQNLGLTYIHYQITDFNKDIYGNGAIQGYFLEITDPTYGTYLGKCVQITGRIKSGWEDITQNTFNLETQYTFERSALLPETVSVLEYDECRIQKLSPSSAMTKENIRSFSGRIVRMNRPASDIAYDYALYVWGEAVNEAFNASGEPTTQIALVPSNHDIAKDIETSVGAMAAVSGYKIWGYAETAYLFVTEISSQ